jgi:hypothetical protein
VAGALNFIGSRALAQKPKAPQFTQEASGRSVMIRSSVDSHKIIYGQIKVSGPIVFVKTTDSGPDQAGATQTGTNRFLHLVLPLAGHEVEEIGDVYLNDTVTPLDVNGWGTDARYSRSVERTTSQTTAIASVARTDYIVRGGTASSLTTVTTTTAHGRAVGENVTLQGVADPSFNGDCRITDVPTPTTFTFNSTKQNATSTGGSITRDSVTTATVSLIRIKKHLGTDSQVADADLVSECGLTSDFRLRGVAYIYVRLEYNPDAFPLGVPNVSVVVKGKKLYDPRTLSTAWSDNAALCIRDYLTSAYGFNCPSAEIDDTYFSAAANICDEDVTLSTGGTQNRYTCNGVVDTATAPLDNLNSLVTALAGAVTYVQGKFRCHAGAYDTPVADIPTSILDGGVSLRARPPRKDLFNAVKGTYVDPNRSWQPTDFPFVTNATYETQDGGQRIYKDLELPFTNHPEAAQRIGKIILEKARQGITVEIAVMHNALRFSVYDVITHTNAQLGWNAKPFRIMKWSTGASSGAQSIRLSLQEESSASYDWNSGEATTVDPAPDTNLPDPFVVMPPGALTLTESLYITRDGAGVKTQVTMAWSPSSDALLKAYQPEYKQRANAIWTRLEATTSLEVTIEDMTPDLYDFRVKAVNTLGVSSTYSTASLQVAGLLDPPTEPQNLGINTIGGFAFLRWALSPDLDVKIGGYYIVRHSSQFSATWNEGVSMGDEIPGSATSILLPLKEGTYMLKAVDSSGIESTDYASIETDQSTVLAFTPLSTITEDPAFAGTKGACFVDELGRLQISGVGFVDDEADFDAIPNLDALGGVREGGAYIFSAGIDLGSVKRVRLTSHVKSIIANVLDFIDSREDDMDAWVNFDGTDEALGDFILIVQSSEDGLSYSTTAPFHSGEFVARYFQFFASLRSYASNYNIFIEELSVTAEELV